MTLTDFLLAQITATEAVAREAAGFEDVSLTWSVHYAGDRIEPDVAPTVWPFAAEHIARHDPAHVLAECAAKRRIIERMQQAVDACDGPDSIELTPYLQDGILRDLASVYADHPDFNPDWRI